MKTLAAGLVFQKIALELSLLYPGGRRNFGLVQTAFSFISCKKPFKWCLNESALE
jgi:hypothetical protein